MTNVKTPLFSFISGDIVEARFSKTSRGNALLLDPDGFSYCMNQKKKNRIYWICNKFGKFGKHKCRGSAITEGFFIVKFSGPEGHCHPANGGSILGYDDSLLEVSLSEGKSNQSDNKKH